MGGFASMLSGPPKMKQPTQVAPDPDKEGQAGIEARRRTLAQNAARSGRVSTMMTSAPAVDYTATKVGG